MWVNVYYKAHYACVFAKENGEVSLFFQILTRAYLIIRLDKEFTNELVDRANLKAKVPQMFGTNF